MTVDLRHLFVSPVAPTNNSGRLVQGPNWNEAHNLQQGPQTLLGRSDAVAGQAATQEIQLDPSLGFVGGKLAVIAGGPPSGPAGGDLFGTYPNPTIKASVTDGQVLTTVAGVSAWATPTVSGGTVTSTSVVSANGLAGTVATATTTPAITLSTTVTGMVKGNGTSLSAATAGTDYMTPANVSAAYQPLDTGLTALSSVGTGIVVNTAADAFSPRTIAGTAARLAVTNGSGVAGNPTLDIDSAYVGQATITTLGTIATGTWQGSVIAGQYGGTGIANTGKTITLGGNLATSGAFASTFTMTGATTVTFPTTGTLATTSQLTAGTVTGVSVVSANGFGGTVATATTTPAITLSTSIAGMLKGNGTAISAAVANTDYLPVASPAFTGTMAGPAVTLTGALTGTTALFAGGASTPVLRATGNDTTLLGLFSGATKGVRIVTNSAQTSIEGVDSTGTGSFQPLVLNGSSVTISPAVSLSSSVTALYSTAIGAGSATQAFIKASSTANLGIYYGNTVPTFSAAKGSLYSNTAATSTTTRLYVNTDGATTWTNLTTAA